MPPLTLRWLLALDIINRCNDPPPDGRPVEITLVLPVFRAGSD